MIGQQIKIFADAYNDDLEDRINEWLKSKPAIKVLYVAQTETNVSTTITILYEPIR